MSTPALHTLVDFFNATGLRYKAYDLGARIQLLAKDTFVSFESGLAPYPAPYLGKANLGLVLWREGDAQAPQIWFLRFALDEQGKLAPAERDSFLRQLLISVGENLDAASEGGKLKGVLDNNPYLWEPAEPLRAAFHAKLTHRLKLAPSAHYPDTLHYLTQGPWDYWQALGLQGLADLVVRWQQTDVHSAFKSSLAQLPDAVLANLAPLFEHEAIDAALTQCWIERLHSARKANQPGQATACLRAIASSEARGMVNAVIEQLLASPPLDAETLVTLATRHNQAISQPELTLPYLEQIAHLDSSAFNRIMAELLFNASLRPAWLAAFRDPHRSERLALAIGALLNGKN